MPGRRPGTGSPSQNGRVAAEGTRRPRHDGNGANQHTTGAKTLVTLVRSRGLLVWAATLWVVLIWGTGWLFIKVGVTYLPPLTLAGSRFTAAGGVLCAIALLTRRPLPSRRGDWLFLASAGLLFAGLASGLNFWGQQFITSGLAAVVWSAMPLVTALLAHWTLPQEPLTPSRALGIAVGFGGVVLASAGGLSIAQLPDLRGVASIFLSAVVWAIALIWTRRRGTRLDPLVVSGVQAFFGGLPLLLVGLALEWGHPIPVTPLTVLDFLYLTLVVSTLTQTVYLWLLQQVGATRVSYISLVVPVIAVIIGAVALHEDFGWHMVGGALGVGAGALLINVPVKRVGGKA